MKKLLCCILVLALGACSKQSDSHDMAASPQPAMSTPAPVDTAARRYIASKHQITLETPAAGLPQQFMAIQAECLKLGCEIIESLQVNELPHQSPHAHLSARVPPAAFERFFKSALAQAKLVEHHTETEDKTAAVIDVEARIKNAEALKARVLDLLAKRTGNMKEILEAEKQLAETQSELDSINGLRRALAQQTDMVRVEIKLVAQSLSVEGSVAAPVSEALHESGRVLMSSLGALITIVVAALPWVLAIVVLVMALRRLNRRRQRKAAAAVKP